MIKIKKKSIRMLQIEEQFGTNIEELLRRLYVDEDFTIKEISSHIGVAYVAVFRWLKQSGIYSKKLESLIEGE